MSRLTLLSFLGLLSVALFACVSVSENSSTKICPSPNSLKASGIPSAFSFVPNDGTNALDFSKVIDFDTARLDQKSAVIIDEKVAEADFAMCLYDNTIVTEKGTMPFFVIKTTEGSKVSVDFRNSKWSGFCWGPEDEQNGCIVVCHRDHKACEFKLQ